MFKSFDDEYPDPTTSPKFECSTGFISDFKRKHRISLRTAHFRQTPFNKEDSEIEKEIAIFKSQVSDIIEKARNSEEPVLNADETGFQILPTSIRTWAFKNAKNVSINVSDNDKERIYIMATISSDFKKLPLFIITKAKDQDDAEEQLGPLLNNNIFTFSEKSYMNSDCFQNYLQFLRNQYPDNRKIHLIIDSYSSHTSKASQKI